MITKYMYYFITETGYLYNLLSKAPEYWLYIFKIRYCLLQHVHEITQSF